jgi:hypothetical protein
MPTTTFPDMGSGFYWSSTNNADGDVWAACYWFGNYHAEVPKTNNELYTMRAVRGGECLLDKGLCMVDEDCEKGYHCTEGVCIEVPCKLFVSHKAIRSMKLTEPRKVKLKITGGEGFDVFGAIDLGPLEWSDVSYNLKKGKLKIKATVPAGLASQIIPISIGGCVGTVEVR